MIKPNTLFIVFTASWPSKYCPHGRTKLCCCWTVFFFTSWHMLLVLEMVESDDNGVWTFALLPALYGLFLIPLLLGNTFSNTLMENTNSDSLICITLLDLAFFSWLHPCVHTTCFPMLLSCQGNAELLVSIEVSVMEGTKHDSFCFVFLVRLSRFLSCFSTRLAMVSGSAIIVTAAAWVAAQSP